MLLFSMMVPGIVAVIASSMLMQLFLQRADNTRTQMLSAAEMASSSFLYEVNSYLPDKFIDMDPTALAAYTQQEVTALSAKTYISNFAVDTNGWITSRVHVALTDSAETARSFDIKFRPTEATVFKGFDPTTGRPVWAFGGTTEALGLFEQVPLISSVDDYPSINIPGIKVTAPLNARILRSAKFGIVLAWDKPANATQAGLVGYRIDSTKNPQCFNKLPDTSIDPKLIVADGYIRLSENRDSVDITSWNCSSTDTSNLVSVRGVGTKGLGNAAFLNLGTVPQYDMDNLSPAAPKNLAATNDGALSATFTWDQVICNFGYATQYMLHSTVKNETAGTFGSSAWFTGTATNGKVSYTMTDILQGSNQGWKVAARCVSSDFGASSSSPQSNQASITTPTIGVPRSYDIAISTVSATAARVTLTAAAETCGANAETVFNMYNNINGQFLLQKGKGSTVKDYTVATGQDFQIRLDASCVSFNKTPISGDMVRTISGVWKSAPAAPTSAPSILTTPNVVGRKTSVRIPTPVCPTGGTSVAQFYSNSTKATATLLANSGGYSTYAIDNAAIGSTALTYTLACDYSGALSAESAKSPMAVWSVVAVPAVPSNFKLTRVYGLTASLSWSKVAGATSYIITAYGSTTTVADTGAATQSTNIFIRARNTAFSNSTAQPALEAWPVVSIVAEAGGANSAQATVTVDTPAQRWFKRDSNALLPRAGTTTLASLDNRAGNSVIASTGAAVTVLQSDNNLVTYSLQTKAAIWASSWQGYTPAYVVLNNGGDYAWYVQPAWTLYYCTCNQDVTMLVQENENSGAYPGKVHLYSWRGSWSLVNWHSM